jgi:hypothetical protein
MEVGEGGGLKFKHDRSRDSRLVREGVERGGLAGFFG